MAFGGGSTGFSFGNTNNANANGFSGFGSTNNTTSAFGASTSGATAFGNTATANPFSGGTSAFGQSTGGFGAANTTNSSPFAKPNPFSTTSTNTNTGGGLFGGGTGNTAGFGATTSNNSFGGSNNSTSGFGFGQAAKPAFGSGVGTTGGLFGQSGQGTTNPFATTNSSPFGGSGSGTALGTQPVPPSDGTASSQFTPTVEKDTPTSTQSNSYQSITFMQPYQKYSFEELRLADYNANRRYGNGTFGLNSFATGNPFSAGQQTSSAGFGNNNNNTSTNGFGGGLFSGGQQNSNTGGFGSSGLFGGQAAKPGGLFNTQPSTGTNSIFGQQPASNTTSNLFGQQPSSNTTSGGLFSGSSGSLFSNNNQPKPASTGFSFGGGGTNTNTAPASTGLFGQPQPQQNTSTSFQGFGAAQNQAKPSLFSTTGTGFGPTSTQGQSNSLFSTSNTGSGGLFSQAQGTNNDANKPGGLFGSTFGNTGANNSGNNLFSNPQTQGNNAFNNPSGGFSFGNTSNDQQQKPSLFSNTQTGSSLFNTSNSSNNPGSLFNSNPNNNTGGLFSQSNQNNNAFGGLMNNSQQQQQQPQQNMPRTASALDQSAYGQSSIWTGLPIATPQNSTPLITPLRAAQNMKDSTSRPPPSLKLNPARYMTPKQKNGYGFTYSTYGTPASAASTPGTGSIFRSGFASSLGRSSLGKSFSASNLHQQYSNSADGVLTPGAMTPKLANFSTGSIRRLKIDHSLRQDLFSSRQPALPAANGASSSSTPAQISDKPSATETADKAPDPPRQQPKKRVSFDRDTTGGGLNGESGALVRTEEEESSAEETQSRGARGRPGTKSANSEMEQVRGKELAVVPEDRVSENESSMRLPTDVNPQPDPEPGEYWMKPTRSELQQMPREKLKSFSGLQVGRRGCGHVKFTGAVDLTAINMDDIFDKIVEIRVRAITVYPEANTKPQVGKGLNVPSTLCIENSWPRARNKPSAATSGPVFDKHLDRLKRMPGTEFLNYDIKTGVWTFTVQHYTRYGLDYDEDDELGDSVIDLPSREDSMEAQTPDEMEVETPDDSDLDDTFMGKRKMIPGGFGRSSVIPYDDEDQGSEQSAPPSEIEDSDNDVDMAGSFPAPAQKVTPEAATPDPAFKATGRPWATPGRPLLDLDGDWAEQLQRTISPRKQNRDALREVQSKVLLDRAYEPLQPERPAEEMKEFRTSIDVMNSLFGKHQQRVKEATSSRTAKQRQEASFEFPYAKRAKIFDPSAIEMTEADAAWHDSFKPNWTGTDRLVRVRDNEQGREIEVVKLTSGKQSSDNGITAMMSYITVKLADGVPQLSHTSAPFTETGKFDKSIPTDGDHDIHHCTAYKLAHVLFDNYEDQYDHGLSGAQRKQYDSRIRRDRLTEFLSVLLAYDTSAYEANPEGNPNRPELLAIVDLCKHDINSAVRRLKGNKDNHLALLMSQLDQADETFQEDMATQVKDWSEQNITSEMSDPIRALYSILSGNTSVVKGKSTGPVEDRSSTFAISERFSLKWLQAFGLTLWYGKMKHGSIEDSIVEFEAKLEKGEEAVTPVDQNGKKDILWVLMKLYASRRGQMARPLLPQAITETNLVQTPMDNYYAFKLHHCLVAKLGKTGEVAVDNDAADKLAADLAFELSSTIEEGKEEHVIFGALFALLHIGDARMREAGVKDLLCRFAAYLHDDSKTLLDQLKIPAKWIWEARAQRARSGHDADAELQCLIKAELYDTAHECLCHRVAPSMVIDEDWQGLAAALAMFPPNAAVKEWADGGALYALFVQATDDPGKADLDELQARLVEMGRKSGTFTKRGEKMGIEELREHVAVKEMSRIVAGMLGDGTSAAVLALPVTSDVRLRATKALAVEYYRGVMAG